MKLHKYGLKDTFDFKEIHFPTTSELTDIHSIIRKKVGPLIFDLENKKLINSYHFILHKDIDLRLSTFDWISNEPKIKDILCLHNIDDNLQIWGPMPPNKYGSEIGVNLCYNNLEYNSRLICALIELHHLTDDLALKKTQEYFIYNQWVHYLYVQYGIKNHIQVQYEFQDALNWLETFVQNNKSKPRIKELANQILDKMLEMTNDFKKRLNLENTT